MIFNKVYFSLTLNQTRIAKLEGEKRGLQLLVESHAKKMAILESCINNSRLPADKGDEKAVAFDPYIESKALLDKEISMIQSSQVDLTPIIESRQYLEKCVQEIEYLLQSSNITSGNSNGAESSSTQPENEQQLSVLQQQESLNTNFNQSSQQMKQKNAPVKQQKQTSKNDIGTKNNNSTKNFEWVPSNKVAGQLDTVRALTFIDSDHLVTGSNDGIITEWKIKFDKKKTIAKTVETHRSHAGPVISLCYDSVTNVIYSGGEDRFIRKWSPDQPMEIGALVAHQGSILSMAIDEQTRRLASVSSDGSVHIWNISSPADMTPFAALEYGSTLTLEEKNKKDTKEGRRSMKEKSGKFDNIDEEKEEGEDEEDDDDEDEEEEISKQRFDSNDIPPAICVTFITGTRQVAVGYENSKIVLYDYEECVKVGEFDIPEDGLGNEKNKRDSDEDLDEELERSVTCLAFSKTLNQLIASYEDGYIRVFDADSGECIYSLKAYRDVVNSIGLLEGDKSFMSSGADGIIKLWSFTQQTQKEGGKSVKDKKSPATNKNRAGDKDKHDETEGHERGDDGSWMCIETFDKSPEFKTQQEALMPLVSYRPSTFGTTEAPYALQFIRKKPEEDEWSRGLVACAGGDGGVRLYMNCESD